MNIMRGIRRHFAWSAIRQACSTSTIVALSVTHFYGVATAADYVVTVLPSLGGTVTSAAAIDGDQVAGWSFPVGLPQHAFSWTAAGGMIDLGTLPGDNLSLGTAVDDGQVVGISTTCGCGASAECCASATGGSSGFPGFSWTQAGGMVGLKETPFSIK